MPRTLLGLFAAVVVGSVASAAPPSNDRVIRWAEVPVGTGVFMTANKVVSGLLVPVPRLGFLSLPVELWECGVQFAPPGAPAGAPQIRRCARFVTLAD